MFKLWKLSMQVFLLQAFTGGIALAFGAVPGIAALVAFPGALIGVPWLGFRLVVINAALASLALSSFADGYVLIALIIGGFGILLLAFLTADQARNDGAEESMFVLFLTALPGGIGALVGGLLLLRHGSAKQAAL